MTSWVSKLNDVVNPTHLSVNGNSIADVSIGGNKLGTVLDPSNPNYWNSPWRKTIRDTANP